MSTAFTSLDFDRPMLIVETPRGDFEVSVARHRDAPTFTFDVVVPRATELADGRLLACQNMTRAQLEELVARCQAALDKQPS